MWTWPGQPLQHELFARTWSSAMKRALVMVLWLLVSHALAVVLYRRGTLPGTRVQLVESEAGLTSQLSAEGWEDMGCSSTHCMSFMFSSLSPLHLRAWMHVSSQGVWNGETQTCDVHSCSLLFLPCIFEPPRVLQAKRNYLQGNVIRSSSMKPWEKLPFSHSPHG